MLVLLFLIFPMTLNASMLDVDRSWNNQFNISSTPYDNESERSQKSEFDTLRDILKDPDNLISSTFEVPKGLKDRVYFWAQVYAVYPSSSVLIHDRDDPSVVYKTVDASLMMSDPKINIYTKDIRFKKKVNEEKENVRKILKKISRAGGIKYFSSRTPEEKRIAKAVKERMTNDESRHAYENVRTQDGQKDNIIKGLTSSSRYLPVMEDIFKENNLPWELTRLPFVESSFEIRAGSKVGAKGIWQIIDKTGKKFMETDSHYDERYSPFKASAVAAKLLKDNYESLGTWPLAITAYNHGPGGLKNAIRRLKTKDISRIVAEYETERFGFASQNFYSEFLAALYVTVYSDRLFGNIEKEHPMNFSYVTIEKDIDIKVLSEVSGLTIEEIQNYNPEFSQKITDGKMRIKAGSKIKLPPRASYKVEEYFIRSEDKSNIKKKLNSSGGINVQISG
jgi:membrane-bound lytic murein transglycosylase D